MTELERLEYREHMTYLALREQVRSDPKFVEAWEKWIEARKALANARLESGEFEILSRAI